MFRPLAASPLRPRGGGVAVAALAALMVLAGPSMVGRAHAQDAATIDKLVQLNKKAMDDYDTAEFDAAKKALLDAEKLGKRSGLESHPVMARTFIHLGALYLVGYKDKNKAQHYFGKALDIQPDIKLDKNLTSPAVRDLFASVQGQKGGGGGGGESPEDLFPPSKGSKASPPPAAEPAPAADSTKRKKTRSDAENQGEPELPTDITALDCPYPDETPPGKKVTLRCVAAPNLKVFRVVLYYKGFEMSGYERVIMTKSAKGWEEATVPKKRVDGKSLQFYFEGLDESDRPVVSNGRAESPNVMLIVAGEAKLAVPAGDEEENPLEADGRGAPRLLLGRVDEEAIGLDTRYGNRRFWLGIGVGTGMVYAVDGVPESRVCGLPPCVSQPIKVSGAGWAGLAHLVPEVGLQFNPNWAIAVAGRHQYILQDSSQAKYTARGAHAVLLKIMHLSKQNRFRYFYGVAGGGGEGVRMNIISDPGGTLPDGTRFKPLRDTILVGGILVGAMGGVYYEFSRGLSLAFEVDALYGFPKTGLTVDGNAMVQFNFGDTSGAAEKARERRKESVAGSIDDEDPQ